MVVVERGGGVTRFCSYSSSFAEEEDKMQSQELCISLDGLSFSYESGWLIGDVGRDSFLVHLLLPKPWHVSTQYAELPHQLWISALICFQYLKVELNILMIAFFYWLFLNCSSFIIMICLISSKFLSSCVGYRSLKRSKAVNFIETLWSLNTWVIYALLKV